MSTLLKTVKMEKQKEAEHETCDVMDQSEQVTSDVSNPPVEFEESTLPLDGFRRES
jgi:hypothetical protein